MEQPRLRISPHLVCLEKSKEGLRFSHFGNIYFYTTEVPELTLQILRLLRSAQPLAQIEATVGGRAALVRNEIKNLLSRRYIFRLPNTLHSPVCSKLKFLCTNDDELQFLSQRLRQSKVGVLDLGNYGPAMRQELLEFGAENVAVMPSRAVDLKSVEKADFFLVLGEPKLKLTFSKLNQLLYRAQKPWLLLTFDLHGGMLGPTFGVPGGPCYDCMIDHSKRHFDRRFETEEFTNLLDDDRPTDMADIFVAKNLLSFAAVESVKILSEMLRPQTFDGFYSFDFLNFRMTFNYVAPSPTCPVCSGFVRDKIR